MGAAARWEEAMLSCDPPLGPHTPVALHKQEIGDAGAATEH